MRLFQITAILVLLAIHCAAIYDFNRERTSRRGLGKKRVSAAQRNHERSAYFTSDEEDSVERFRDRHNRKKPRDRHHVDRDSQRRHRAMSSGEHLDSREGHRRRGGRLVSVQGRGDRLVSVQGRFGRRPNSRNEQRVQTTRRHNNRKVDMTSLLGMIGLQRSLFDNISYPDITMLLHGAPFNWNIKKMFRQKDWWHGPNVCKHEAVQESDESTYNKSPDLTVHSLHSNVVCDEFDSMYRCMTKINDGRKTRSVTTTYECCHGYKRKGSSRGCNEKIELADIFKTMENSGARLLSEALKGMKLKKTLLGGNYTIFAPDDGALGDVFPSKNAESNYIVVDPGVGEMGAELRQALSAHVVPGLARISKLSDEQIINSVNPNAKIRINMYESPTKIITANCMKLLSSDNLARDGVVHVVNGVIKSTKYNLNELVGKQNQLSTLKSILDKTGVGSLLEKAGQFTLFAPTNEAFSKLSKPLLNQILDGNECLSNIITNHVLPNVICSPVVQGRVRSANMLSKQLEMRRLDEKRITVGKANVTISDVMATNGVLHVIDDIILPDEALDMMTVIKNSGADSFLSHLEANGLLKRLSEMKDVTLFLPTNNALKNYLNQNNNTRRNSWNDILNSIVVPKQIRAEQLYNDKRFKSLNGIDLHVKEYSSYPFASQTSKNLECSAIVKSDLKSCNGVVHLVDKVLNSPVENFLKTLSHYPQFSEMARLIKKGGLETILVKDNKYTLFAPTNTAFEELSNQMRIDIEKDLRSLRRFIQHHMIRDVLCCNGIFSGSWMWTATERTLAGSHIQITRIHSPFIDNVRIDKCDLRSTDGVVHQLDRVLPKSVREIHAERRRDERRSAHSSSTDPLSRADGDWRIPVNVGKLLRVWV